MRSRQGPGHGGAAPGRETEIPHTLTHPENHDAKADKKQERSPSPFPLPSRGTSPHREMVKSAERIGRQWPST
jgi:hypothetical protein